MSDLDHTTNPPLKRCSKCGVEFPATLEYFHRDKTKKFGISSSCRTCARQRTKQWRQDNNERANQNDKNYREHNRDKIAAYKRNWAQQRLAKDPDYYHRRYCQNPLKYRTRNRHQYYKNRHSRVEYSTNYNRIHSDQLKPKRALYARNRAARRKGLPADSTIQDWQRALDYFNGCCAVCGRPPGLWHTIAQDHWIPLANPNCPGTISTNIVPLCHGQDGCNNSKQDRNAKEWLMEKYGPYKAQQILKRIEAYFAWVKEQDS